MGGGNRHQREQFCFVVLDWEFQVHLIDIQVMDVRLLQLKQSTSPSIQFPDPVHKSCNSTLQACKTRNDDAMTNDVLDEINAILSSNN